jgi:hypothetical protein
MITYSFSANGRKIEVEANRMLEAMDKANKLFGPMPQGAWVAKSSLRDYYWAKGNFFD